MKVSKKYVESQIETIAKQVEELSGLKTNVSRLNIERVGRFELMKKESGNLIQKYATSQTTLAIYFHNLKNFFGEYLDLIEFPKRFYGNKDYLNSAIGHELMHNAQYSSFPEFYRQIRVSKADRKNNPNEYLANLKLLEGDARFIQKKLAKKYYDNAHFKIPDFLIKHYKKSKDENRNNIYENPCQILENDFKGDRKEINQLYLLPSEELDYIFNR